MIARPTIDIGGRAVGEGESCLVIAEAGVNHNGDPDLAFRLIDAAADAGADAVKFQTFRADAVAARDARRAAYQNAGRGEGDQRSMLRALELDGAVFRELAAHCRRRGVGFLSTAFDPDSLQLVRALGPAALKWPSGEIDNVPLLREAAASDLPVLLSTGMAGLGEIERALAELDAGGCPGVAVLHCTSSYPAPPEDLNLRAMASLGAAFGRPVGFSDHSEGWAAALAARALGMAVLEKHFTLDRALPGPDHAASLEPSEFARLVAELRSVEAALGDGVKRLRPSEEDTRRVSRRGLRAARHIRKGETFALGDLAALRPCEGVSPAHIDLILGRAAARDIPEGAAVDWSDIG